MEPPAFTLVLAAGSNTTARDPSGHVVYMEPSVRPRNEHALSVFPGEYLLSGPVIDPETIVSRGSRADISFRLNHTGPSSNSNGTGTGTGSSFCLDAAGSLTATVSKFDAGADEPHVVEVIAVDKGGEEELAARCAPVQSRAASTNGRLPVLDLVGFSSRAPTWAPSTRINARELDLIAIR